MFLVPPVCGSKRVCDCRPRDQPSGPYADQPHGSQWQRERRTYAPVIKVGTTGPRITLLVNITAVTPGYTAGDFSPVPVLQCDGISQATTSWCGDR
jgi:hypothetical protein